MAVTLTDVQEDLAYLLGEQSAPTSTTSDYAVRERFIQRALERAYRAFDFPFSKTTATMQVSAMLASLPANMKQDSVLDVREVTTGNDRVYKQVDFSSFDNYTAGDYVYRLTGYEGAYLLETKETNDPVLTVHYTTKPVINASVSTPFPSSMGLARGAMIFYRQSEDPQADIGQEEALFQAELTDVIATYNRSRPRRKMVDKYTANNTYLGDTGYF